MKDHHSSKIHTHDHHVQEGTAETGSKLRPPAHRKGEKPAAPVPHAAPNY